MKQWAKQTGFTIVELLIVIVVIAILAAITIVAFNGIQQRAQSSALSSALSQATRKLELYKVDNSGYPATPSDAGIIATGDMGVAYSTSTTDYCIAYVKNGKSVMATNSNTAPREGGCVPNNGLVAEWLFNGNANDTGGNGINGTVNGATATTGRSGQANTAYAFNGISNYIALPASSALNFTAGQFSVSAWINLSTISTTAAWYDILSSTGTGDWSVGINGNASAVGRLMMTKISQTDSPSASVVDQNVWKQVTAVYTAGSPSATVEFYIDGVSTGTVLWNHTPQGTFTSATKRIGSRSAAGYFKGSIDEIRVFNRAITPAEVASLYAAGPQ